MMAYIKLLRCKHWIKNLLVLVPLFFGHAIFSNNAEMVVHAFVGMFAFCFTSSAIYILNDIKDAEKDAKHPLKCKRPIASGAVSIRHAWLAFACVATVAVVLAILAGGGWQAWLVLVLYGVLNIAYSLGLKKIALVDVIILASGFFLRVLYGSGITGIEISTWLYLTVVSLSFYLGLGKRRGEWKAFGEEAQTRDVLKRYPLDFLNSSMTVFFGLTLCFYALWAIDANTIARTSEFIVWTIPVMYVVCLRYSFLISGSSLGDPVEVVTHDKALIALIIGYVALMVGVVYFG